MKLNAEIVDERGDGGVYGEEDKPDEEGSWDGEDGVFGPDVGDEGRFTQHDEEDGRVGGGAPKPVAGNLAVGEDEVVFEEEGREKIGEEAVVEAVADPGEEGVHAEEGAALAKAVELWVAVEETSRNELVADAHGERREDGEEDVVE